MQLTIYFDIAAVILGMMLMVALIIRGLVKGRSNVFFLILNGLNILSAVFDIITCLYGVCLPENEYTIPTQAFYNYLFFYIHNFSAPFYILYLSSILRVEHALKETKWFKYAFSIPYIIDVAFLIMNNWTDCVFGFTSEGKYYRGYMLYVLYIVAFYYMTFGIIFLIKLRHLLSKIKFNVLLLYIPIATFPVLLQLVNPVYRLETFAIAVMALLVAIVVQRPEENLDQVANTQSSSAFINDVKMTFITKRPISILFIKIVNDRMLRNNIGIEKHSKFIRYVSNKITRISAAMSLTADIYYLNQGIFAIITDRKKKENLEDVARLMVAYLKDPIRLNEYEINTESKVVIADCPEDIKTAPSLINFAYSFYYSLQENNKLLKLSDYAKSEDFKLKSNMDAIISRALLEHNFRMYYQPIYSVKDKKFISSEALIRLKDKEYGFVSPGIFIPAAEESGAIHAIGDFVVDSVCKFMSNSEVMNLGVKYIEINLSVAQCIEPDLIKKMTDKIKEYGLTSDCLNLEITETAVDYDRRITDQNIHGLMEAGFLFSLDDYGTGYSNTTRVATMQVEIVKLDKSFVDEIKDPAMYKITKYSIEMFQKINKKILVEGIEDKETLDIFIELGCDYIQGFYFSKPLPEDEYIEFIRKANFTDGGCA